jgi:hypothetical protein
MCGRITLTRPNLESVASELNVALEGCRCYPIPEPHYNIARTSVVPILTLDENQVYIADDLGQHPEDRSGPNHQERSPDTVESVKYHRDHYINR